MNLYIFLLLRKDINYMKIICKTLRYTMTIYKNYCFSEKRPASQICRVSN